MGSSSHGWGSEACAARLLRSEMPTMMQDHKAKHCVPTVPTSSPALDMRGALPEGKGCSLSGNAAAPAVARASAAVGGAGAGPLPVQPAACWRAASRESRDMRGGREPSAPALSMACVVATAAAACAAEACCWVSTARAAAASLAAVAVGSEVRAGTALGGEPERSGECGAEPVGRVPELDARERLELTD